MTNPTDLVELEHKVLVLWKNLDLVEAVREKNKGGPKFSFFDGPVTANNALGVHHAWGRTLKDVVQRFKALQGYDQRLQYGFDTQGLWVEVEVEKALGFNSKQQLESYGVNNFVDACKARVDKYSKVQDMQSSRLGMLKSNDSYYTHTDENVSAIWNFLSTCHRNGWLYKGVRPMPWCPRCGTSLSAHEQTDSYKEVKHTSVYTKFPLKGQDDTYFLVWTTTPWTLPANLAVAVHPEKKYGYFTRNGETLIAGTWLQYSLLQEYEMTREVTGSDLVGHSYQTPFVDLEVHQNRMHAVVPWTEVTEMEGTGVVHLAPGCGREDFELLKELSDTFDPLSPLLEDGTYDQGYGAFSGKDYTDVNHMVVRKLQEKDLLFKADTYSHRYPHCWRCKTELVYRVVDEWFLSMNEIRPLLIEAAEKVNWNPVYTKKLFLNWVENMEDWCVSRKRYWGLPLPFYQCDCGQLTVVSSKDKFLSNAVGDTSKVKELHLPWVDQVQYPCDACDRPVQRISEVGDCWLDAGVMPFSTLDYFSGDREYWRKWFPAEFVCEMREQVRLWFYSMMVLSVTLTGQPPFKTVMSYEMVRDKNNQTMHKSGKNNVVLDDALEVLGADTLRLYYLTQSRTSNMRFDFDVGKERFNLLRKLLHSFKFFQTYADLEELRVDLNKLDPVEFMHSQDQWMVSRLDTHLAMYLELLDSFDFQAAVSVLQSAVVDLSNWYLRRVRERVWNKKEEHNHQVYHTLFVVFRQLCLMFAPVTPFVAELVYQNLREYTSDLPRSVHLDSLVKLGCQNLELETNMQILQDFTEMNRQVRNNAGVKLRQPLSVAYVWGNELKHLPDTMLQSLEELLNVEEVQVLEDPRKYVHFSLKPEYSKLGPKYGSQVNKVTKQLSRLSEAKAATFVLNKHESLHLKDFHLEAKEVMVELHGKDDLELVTSGDTLLLVDTSLSEHLRYKGWLRDFMRQVQMDRKNLGLQVEERVVLQVTGKESLTKYLVEQSDELVKQLYLSNLEVVVVEQKELFNHKLGNLKYTLIA